MLGLRTTILLKECVFEPYAKWDTPSAVSAGFMVTTVWRARELLRRGQQERHKDVVTRSRENVQILLGECFVAFKISASSTRPVCDKKWNTSYSCEILFRNCSLIYMHNTRGILLASQPTGVSEDPSFSVTSYEFPTTTYQSIWRRLPVFLEVNQFANSVTQL
jgi:hypothetical protein